MTKYQNEMTTYIDKIVTEITNLEQITLKEAFEKLTLYISVHSFLGADVPCVLKSETAEFLDAYIDINDLKNSKVDFLGEFYFTKILKKKNLFPCVICDIIKSQTDKNAFPKPVMIDDIRTGNKAIQTLGMADGENVIMYATSDDIDTYRICQINRHLYDLPLFVLYINPKSKNREQIDLRTSSENWLFANRWNPTPTSLLKTIS